MHPSHLPSPDGAQCDRCNVIATEVAAQVPCLYTGVWGPRDTTPVVRVHEWRGTCAVPTCDVTVVLRSPQRSADMPQWPRGRDYSGDWPLEFSVECPGCGRDLLVTSAGEVPRPTLTEPNRSAVLGLAVAARLERQRNPSFRDFMLLAEIAWDGAQGWTRSICLIHGCTYSGRCIHCGEPRPPAPMGVSPIQTAREHRDMIDAQNTIDSLERQRDVFYDALTALRAWADKEARNAKLFMSQANYIDDVARAALEKAEGR